MISSLYNSSIGKKQVMAVTGIALCGFILVHLLGNITMVIGSDLFNMYAYKLTQHKAILYSAEVVLALIFLPHIFMAIKLTLENRAARPVKYYMKKNSGNGATIASNTMPITGSLLGIFLVAHILHFKFGAYYLTTIDGLEVRDIFRTVVEFYSSPFNVAYYVISMFALGLHASHGVQSIFQSLGLFHPKYTPFIKKIGLIFALLVGVVFSGFALWAYISFKGAF